MRRMANKEIKQTRWFIAVKSLTGILNKLEITDLSSPVKDYSLGVAPPGGRIWGEDGGVLGARCSVPLLPSGILFFLVNNFLEFIERE